MLYAPKEGTSPFRIFCKNCGAPAEFSIEKQSYVCSACGEVSGVEEFREHVLTWRSLQQRKTKESLAALPGEGEKARPACWHCPSCGAEVLMPMNEGTAHCDFCGSNLVSREFEVAEDFPELVLPFKITAAQAKDALTAWAKENAGTPEAEAVTTSLSEMQAYYLPYRLVRGAVRGEVTRDRTSRAYTFHGYVTDALVNVSEQLDNDVLDHAEPFNPDSFVPFEHGYIAGHKLKLCDLSAAKTEERIAAESADDIRPIVEEVLEYDDVAVSVAPDELSELPVLVPMYFIKNESLMAAVNGETGKVAVSVNMQEKSKRWLVEPTIISLALMAAVCYWMVDWTQDVIDVLGHLVLAGFVIGMIVYSVFANGRHNQSFKKIVTGKEIAGIPEKPRVLPIFYEIRNGVETAVRYRFHAGSRSIIMLGEVLFMLFLPALIAMVIRLFDPLPGYGYWDSLAFCNGAAWYTLLSLPLFLYWSLIVRRVQYNFPITYEILPDQSLQLITKNIRLYVLPGIFKMIRTGEVFNAPYRWMTVIVIFILVMSVIVILDP